MASRRPTQADVARIAGVSRATVSYVLNEHDDQRVPISAETRQRVQQAIAELGYEVNARAQALRSGTTRTIGVLVPIYENPFYLQLLHGVVEQAGVSGYSVLLSHSVLTPEQEIASLRDLVEQRVDGLILLIDFNYLPEPVLNQLRRSSASVVEISVSRSEFDYVQQGYGAGMRALLDHLIAHGHRRIGFIYGVTRHSQGLDRFDAYRYALNESGIGFDPALVRECGPLLADGYAAAVDLLRLPDRPTALVAINDLQGIAALRAAADLGLHVPRDLSIASFDDIPFSSYTIPRLTTVSGNPEQSGRDAVRLLLERLQHPDRPPHQYETPWELIVRESTGPAPTP